AADAGRVARQGGIGDRYRTADEAEDSAATRLGGRVARQGAVGDRHRGVTVGDAAAGVAGRVARQGAGVERHGAVEAGDAGAERGRVARQDGVGEQHRPDDVKDAAAVAKFAGRVPRQGGSGDPYRAAADVGNGAAAAAGVFVAAAAAAGVAGRVVRQRAAGDGQRAAAIVVDAATLNDGRVAGNDRAGHRQVLDAGDGPAAAEGLPASQCQADDLYIARGADSTIIDVEDPGSVIAVDGQIAGAGAGDLESARYRQLTLR